MTFVVGISNGKASCRKCEIRVPKDEVSPESAAFALVFLKPLSFPTGSHRARDEFRKVRADHQVAASRLYDFHRRLGG
jgi:hypothetical protein